MLLILTAALLIQNKTYISADERIVALQMLLPQRIVAEQQALNDTAKYSLSRIATVPQFSTLEDWQKYAEETRRSALERVVFRGAATSWRDAATAVEMRDDVELPATADGGPGYRIQKFRLEVLPNLWVPGLLYLPKELKGKVPVFLNVNGHDLNGKAADYKQARCIHMVRQGIIAMNLEWFGMGQLTGPGYAHGRLNQLDLCGTSGLAPFYLAMSRALDLLLSLENADPQRVGVAGLSGGGWQTILISSLDTRVTLCNPVAGYSSFRTRIGHSTDLGDSEQTPVDLGITADYTHLTALLAPRAALLTYNDKDNCCFASGHALSPLVEAANPVYRLYGMETRFRTYVNSDPGTHNFLIDNRQSLYRMIRDQWFEGDEQRFATTERPVDAELRTAAQLEVALPDPNLTFQGLALALAESLPKAAPMPEVPGEKAAWKEASVMKLKETVKPRDYPVTAEQVSQQTIADVQVTRWRLSLGTDWVVPVTEIVPASAKKLALLLHDEGQAKAAERIDELLRTEHRVFVMDPVFFGQLGIAERSYLWALMISTTGERPLGIQTGQVASVAAWIRQTGNTSPLTVVTDGPRSGVIGLVAAVMFPDRLTTVQQHRPLESLKHLLRDNYSFEQAPELFCFGLLETTDIPMLNQLQSFATP